MKPSKQRTRKSKLPVRVTPVRHDPLSDTSPPAQAAVYDIPLALKGLHNTPFNYNENSQKDGFDDKHAKARDVRYAEQAMPWIVGPTSMPVEDFIRAFLPGHISLDGMPEHSNAFNTVFEQITKEEDIYPPLISEINGNTTQPSRCPGFLFVNTSQLSETSGLGSMKPDLCCFAKESLDKLRRLDGRTPGNLGYAELFIEVKKTPQQDFFCDPPLGIDHQKHNFILDHIHDQKKRARAKEALGQNIGYAAEACALQHRLFYLSISLSGPYARFIRWDRAGAIVSRSFSIEDQPQLLCEFLWRFSHASSEERGYDPTIGWASQDEERHFKDAITARVKYELNLTDVQIQNDPKAVNEHYQKGSVFAMRVVGFGLDGPRSLRLFVSRPVVSPLAMASRATRGYWAVTEDNGVVFLKDTWRHTAFDLELESDILADLNKFNVRHIAHLVIHGDVHYKSPAADGGEDMEKDIVQRTQTDTFQDSEWSCTGQRKLALSPHVHYRLVTSTVGYPLAQFIGTQELLQTTFHAFEAMKDAFAHGRLHRDISLGNIILVRSRAGKQEREGCLIDWELSYLIIGKNDARAYRRTGTWQFMSLNLLTVYEQEPHSIRDDIESMFYFVLYCSL